MKTRHINVIHVYIEKMNILRIKIFFSLVQNRNILKSNITKKGKIILIQNMVKIGVHI